MVGYHINFKFKKKGVPNGKDNGGTHDVAYNVVTENSVKILKSTKMKIVIQVLLSSMVMNRFNCSY